MTRQAGPACEGCRFWSEMIAKSDPSTSGQVAALCLNAKSPEHGQYKVARSGCNHWASGHLGAVDMPGEDAQRYENEETPCPPA